MSLFNRKDTTMSEPEITGTEAIRRRLHGRWKKVNLAKTASDLGIGLSRLEAFAKGEGKLPEAEMHLLCKEFYSHNTRFDPIADKLLDVSPPPDPPPVMPDPYDHTKDSELRAGRLSKLFATEIEARAAGTWPAATGADQTAGFRMTGYGARFSRSGHVSARVLEVCTDRGTLVQLLKESGYGRRDSDRN